jgi:phage antirepressor YoqD-like protein
MSSTEIAKLTNKEKSHIHRDIKVQILAGLYGIEDYPDLDRIDIKGIFAVKRDNGQIAEILLDRYHTDILVSGYEVKYRAAIVKRWHELEEQATKPQLNPANLSRLQLIHIALEAEQELQAEKEKTAILEPKAQALDRIATATDGALCPTDAAKMLQVPPRKLIGWLQANRWMYKRAGSRYFVGYQDKIQTGYLEHKEKAIKLADGSDKMTCQVLVTAKGLTKLSGIVSKGGAL